MRHKSKESLQTAVTQVPPCLCYCPIVSGPTVCIPMMLPSLLSLSPLEHLME